MFNEDSNEFLFLLIKKKNSLECDFRSRSHGSQHGNNGNGSQHVGAGHAAFAGHVALSLWADDGYRIRYVSIRVSERMQWPW